MGVVWIDGTLISIRTENPYAENTTHDPRQLDSSFDEIFDMTDWTII